MAKVRVVKRTVELEVVLEEEEFKVMRKFIHAFGFVLLSKAEEWQKGDGFPLWKEASRVAHAVERQLNEVRAR